MSNYRPSWTIGLDLRNADSGRLRTRARVSLNGVMLVAALVATTIATAQATPRPTPQRFKLDGRSLTGQPKSICVIEGKWADGEHLRYESWDSCSKMHVRRVHQKDHKDAHPLGTEDHYSVKDIPRGSEVLEFNNSVSTVLVIRDANGSQREILSGD